MWFFKKRNKIHALHIYFNKVIFYFCLIFFSLFLIRFFIVSGGQVNGKSMEPTFLDNDLFFINKYVYLFHPPKRYDVIQLINKNSGKLLIKRIIGLPGETIIIKRGKVYLQKTLKTQPIELDETQYLLPDIYTRVNGQHGAAKFIIGNNQYFVMGDNRPNSIDSRYYGPIKRTQITGKVMQNFLDIFK